MAAAIHICYLLPALLGEQLESIHIERQRAQAAYDLLDFYNLFSHDDVSRLDAMKKEGREGRRRVAILLRRLVTVAKEVDLSDSATVRIVRLIEMRSSDQANVDSCQY